MGPVSVEHLKWKASAHGKGDFPLTFDCLLDNSAHLVLIRPEAVKKLDLEIHKLRKPELMSLALKQSTGINAFTDYVFLTLSSINNVWSSLPICAILAPDLCINILLGLPFLKHNKIVIDHDLHTAVHKPSSFDLLNENVFPKHCAPSKSSPYQHRVLFSRQQKEFLSELKITCTNRLTELERINYFERVTPYNVIAAIKDTISILASKQKLLDLESSIKKDFKPLFLLS